MIICSALSSHLGITSHLNLIAVGARLHRLCLCALRFAPGRTSSHLGIASHLNLIAVGARFELAVQLPVRQFSKLLVSATHPSHHPRLTEGKNNTFFSFLRIFLQKKSILVNKCSFFTGNSYLFPLMLLYTADYFCLYVKAF